MTKRRYQKLCGNRDWFRNEDDEVKVTESHESWKNKVKKRKNAQRIEAVQFIPLTDKSELKRRITEMELASRFTTRFRYVEMAGQSLVGSLSKSDPWDTPCGREKCFPCQSQVGKCMAQGCNYVITCLRCKTSGKKTDLTHFCSIA